MSRSYRKVRPQKHRVYSVEDVMGLYGVSRNTVSNWRMSGLCSSDEFHPLLYRGAELIRFHLARKQTQPKLPFGVFNCFTCKAAIVPDAATLSITADKPGVYRAMAYCPECSGTVAKFLDETECDTLRKRVESKTSLGSVVEEAADSPTGIGKLGGSDAPPLSSCNDRLLHAWQNYAGRYDAKTTEAHLASIRAFEQFIGHKPFPKVTTTDADTWRNNLVASEGDGLARGTLRHRASHLRLFFDWLGKQPAYRHLEAIAGYFVLPKRFRAKIEPPPRAFPTLDEAITMLAGMPTLTWKERRARAIFAFAFISGFRADALITVRLHHLDMASHRVRHDGRQMRTKNGKSFTVNWFPRTGPFRQVFKAWYDDVISIGFGPDDALFPDLKALAETLPPSHAPIAPMESCAAVTEAFRIASRVIGRSYSPHSARHTLAHLGDQICRTAEERKSWSLNLGHASEAVTWTHYGKVSDQRKDDIFEAFEDDTQATSDELNLILAYHEHELVPGTPEFKRAEALTDERKRLRQQRER